MVRTQRNTGSLAFLILLAACGAKAEFGPEKPVPDSRPVDLSSSTKQRFGLRDMPPAMGGRTGDGSAGQGRAGEGGGFAAETPAGWSVLAPSEYRQLNWRVAGSPDAECYLTAGNVRGGALMNVNRWIGQFGKPPLDAAALAALPKHTLLGHEALLVTAEGTFGGMGGALKKEGFALLGLVAGPDSDMITLKMTGPKAVVDAQRETFLRLAQAIRRAAPGEAAQGQAGTSGAAGAEVLPGHGPAPGPDGFSATVPAAWSRVASGKAQHHKFGQGSEIYVSQLGSDLRPMFDIWRGEMGLPALDDPGFAALGKLPMLGGEALLLDVTGDFAGMGGKRIAGARLLVAAVKLGNSITFVKCIGPADEIGANRSAFTTFCSSLHRRDG
jgi:hypothetical protein